MESPDDICGRIREVRESLRLKPGQFAERLGVKPQRIQDIERGKQRPPADVIAAIVETFHVDAGWILLGKGDMFQGDHLFQVSEDGAAYGRKFDAELEAFGRATAAVRQAAQAVDVELPGSLAAAIVEFVYNRAEKTRSEGALAEALIRLVATALDTKPGKLIDGRSV